MRILLAGAGLRGVIPPLEKAGYTVETAADSGAAWEMYQAVLYALVVTEFDGGLDLLAKIKAFWPPTEVVIMTNEGEYRDVINALKLRARLWIEKGEPDAIAQLLNLAAEMFPPLSAYAIPDGLPIYTLEEVRAICNALPFSISDKISKARELA